VKHRWLLFLFFFVMVWAIWLTQQPKALEEPQEDPKTSADFWNQIQGEVIQYRSFRADGQAVLEVKARTLAQVDEATTQVEDYIATYHLEQGKTLRIRSDRVLSRGNRREFRADPGKWITLEEEGGLKLTAPNQLILEEDGHFWTEETASFHYAGWQGQTVGLSYRPGDALTLKSEVSFYQSDAIEPSYLLAHQLHLDLVTTSARVQQGLLVLAEEEQKMLSLSSEWMTLGFHRSLQESKERFALEHVSLEGSPCQAVLPSGTIQSTALSLCFLTGSPLVDTLESHAEVHFEIQTKDRQEFHVQTENLLVFFQANEPQTIRCWGHYSLNAKTLAGDPLTFEGKEGLVSHFEEAHPQNTFLFGQPAFQGLGIEGTAQRMRVIHDKNQLFLSTDAQLKEEHRKIQLHAHEILVDRWPERQRTIFARGGVRFEHQSKSDSLEGGGQQLTFIPEDGSLELTGALPMAGSLTDEGEQAILIRGGSRLQANRFFWLDLQKQRTFSAEGNVHGLWHETQGPLSLSCKTFHFDELRQALHFEEVEEMNWKTLGRFSATSVDLEFRNTKQGPSTSVSLKSLIGLGKVHFHLKPQDDPQKALSGRADRLDYHDFSSDIILSGLEKPVTMISADGQTSRARRLIYSLVDASIRMEGGDNGFTETILTIEPKQEKDKPKP
jgi:lipopolysaccharide export system protein LptA